MPDHERGRLDNAIDRAVRGMMQIDPRPGLGRRVADRLHKPARRALWMVPAFGVASLAVAIFAAIPLLRSSQPQPPAEQPIAVAPSRPLSVPPSTSAPAPATTPAPSSARRQPVPAKSIFGPQRDRVTATSVPAAKPVTAATPPAKVLTSPNYRELRQSAPIAINPIDVPPAPSRPSAPVSQTPAAQPAREATSRPDPPQAINVRVEVMILEQTGQAAPARKVVTLLTSDRQNGSIRSGGSVQAGEQRRSVVINVDARPTLLGETSLRMDLSLEYQPQSAGGVASEPGLWTVREHVNVVLESGKPLLVSETFDPTSDRRVTVEVKATVVR